MNFQIAFGTLTLVGLTAVSSIVSAQSTCAIVPERDPRVASRANSIRFPDGRLITVVGHVHGDRQVFSLGMTAPKVQSWSAAELERYIRKALKENADTTPALRQSHIDASIAGFEKMYGLPAGSIGPITYTSVQKNFSVLQTARDDEQYLRSRLNQASHRPSFVGVESYGQQNIEFFRGDYKFVRALIASRRAQMKLSSAEIEDFLRSGTMGQTYLFFERPDLTRGVHLVAEEGPEADINGDKAVNVDPKAMDQFIESTRQHLAALPNDKLAKAHSELAIYGRAFFKIFLASNDRFVEFESGDAVAAYLHRATPEWLRLAGQPIEEGLRAYAASYIKRDQQTAENLADERATGIHYIGLEHLRSVMKRLRHRCEIEAGRPRGSTAPEAVDAAR